MIATSDWLNRISREWVALLATAVFVLFIVLVLPAQAPIEGPGGTEVRSPDLSLWYSPATLYETAEAYGPDGRNAYVRARVTFDVVWPIVYVAFLATALSWIHRARGDEADFWRRTNLAPVLAGAFDYLENVCTATVMLRFPDTTPVLDALAPVFTVAKWTFLTAAFVLLAVGLVSVAWRRLARIWHPAWYQDGRKRHGYFEGWYFKCVDAAAEHAVAVIPGISLARGGEGSHVFVQLIRAGGRTAYWEYPAEEFRFAPNRFEISIGPNRFTSESIRLDLDGPAGRVEGELRFGEWLPWPVRLLSPGIMGPYRFVPFMETYHGVLGLDHAVSGELVVDGETLRFDGGRGYVEKDWGRSFPSAWVWAQSNHFGAEGVSVTISVARIPWLGSSFVGYIVGLLVDGTLHEFTTYNGAKMRSFSLREGEARMTLERRGLALELTVEGAHPGELRSPVLGAMEGTVWESLDARIGVRLSRGETVVFEGQGQHAGVELMDEHGDLEMKERRR